MGSANPVFNGSTNSFAYMGDVPIRTCNGNLSRGDRSFLHYFNTSCFQDPPAGPTGIAVMRGNAGRNIIVGPGINNWDLALIKSISLRESKTLQFSADTVKACHHPQ